MYLYTHVLIIKVCMSVTVCKVEHISYSRGAGWLLDLHAQEKGLPVTGCRAGVTGLVMPSQRSRILAIVNLVRVSFCAVASSH